MNSVHIHSPIAGKEKQSCKKQWLPPTVDLISHTTIRSGGEPNGREGEPTRNASYPYTFYSLYHS